MSNAFVLAVINVAVEHAAEDRHSVRHLALFVLSLLLYVVAQKYIMTASTAEIETILHRIRVRLADKVRQADLRPLESVGRAQIYASVNKETQTISQAAAAIIVGFQAGILIFFTLLYIAWLSPSALFLFGLVCAIAVTVHFRQIQELNRKYHASMQQENKLFELLTHVLDGFKEVKLHQKRGSELQAHLSEVSQDATNLKVETQTQTASQFVFSQTMFYILVAAMVFLVPRLSDTYDEVVIKATTAILFLIGPISNLVSSIPIFTNANAAVENVYGLERLLDETREQVPEPQASAPEDAFLGFRHITFHGVTFQFSDPRTAASFTVGPLDFEVQSGEMLFIAGGNGSGKSTFLKLLTALYHPKEGVIRIDGVGLSDTYLAAYRRLFSAVFTDYHLFDRLYGLRDVEAAAVERLLRDLGLQGKTTYSEGSGFTTLDLSTGQKKRLALLVSLLEDRSIYVFDEWAADQDPTFRRRFYEELLPRLKERGKTIIAVTHDDRYYDCADRILKMDEGRFVEPMRAVER